MNEKELLLNGVKAIQNAYDGVNFGNTLPNKMGFILMGVDSATIAIRGTELNKIEDILTDLDGDFVTWQDGMVHDGALKRYKETFSDDLINKLSDLDLIIYGHSMGAWLAALLATDTRIKGKVTLVMYASPKLCNFDFLSTIRPITVYSLASYHDIIPHFPMGFIQPFPVKHLKFNVPVYDELANHHIDNFYDAINLSF
jgi:pimeloyl-ACP methyl ester carboxylesterase